MKKKKTKKQKNIEKYIKIISADLNCWPTRQANN